MKRSSGRAPVREQELGQALSWEMLSFLPSSKGQGQLQAREIQPQSLP